MWYREKQTGKEEEGGFRTEGEKYTLKKTKENGRKGLRVGDRVVYQ